MPHSNYIPTYLLGVTIPGTGAHQYDQRREDSVPFLHILVHFEISYVESIGCVCMDTSLDKSETSVPTTLKSCQ